MMRCCVIPACAGMTASGLLEDEDEAGLANCLVRRYNESSR